MHVPPRSFVRKTNEETPYSNKCREPFMMKQSRQEMTTPPIRCVALQSGSVQLKLVRLDDDSVMVEFEELKLLFGFEVKCTTLPSPMYMP